MSEQLLPQSVIQFLFQPRGVFTGAQHANLVLFEVWGNEALGIDQRLFANIGLRHVFRMRFPHFNVIAKDLVKADAQGVNASAFALLGLKRAQPILARGIGIAQGIEFGVIARTNDEAVAQRRRRLFDNGLGNAAFDIGEAVPLRGAFDEPGALPAAD